MGVIAKRIPRGCQGYSPPCPWDTHYSFSIIYFIIECVCVLLGFVDPILGKS